MRIPIGIKLMAGFLAVVVLLAVFAVYSLRISRAALQESVGKSTVFLVEETLKRIDQNLYRRVEDLQIYTGQAWLRRAVADASAAPGTAANELSRTLRNTFLTFYEHQYGYKVFTEVFITDARGGNIAQTGPTSDQWQADEAWWQTAKDTGLSVGDVAYDDSAETYGMSIGVRINDDTGRFIGVIKAVVDIKGITREAELVTRKYTTTRMLLATRDGGLIYSTKPYRFLEDVSQTEIFTHVDGENGFFVTDVGDIAMLYSYAHSKGYRHFAGFGWILLIGYDVGEVFQPITALRNQIVVVSAIVLTVGIGLSLVMSHALSTSIRILIQGVQTIGQGNLTHRVAIKTNDEIGDLATAFNLMAERRYLAEEELRTHRDHLDELVKTRTVELQHAKEAAEEARQAAETAQQAAETANQAKSAFLANMSHELRTPLNAILGFAQIMARNPKLPPEERENADTIQRSGDHLLTLINQVLDFSKIEAGRITLQEQPCDLYRVFADVKNMFSLKAEQKGIRLSVEYAADLSRYMWTDEVKLRQVLINVIGNAVKFTQAGGVTVRVKRVHEFHELGNSETQQLLFEIEDTGVGIAAEEMPHVFEAFTQTESGRLVQEGTGLGLPISRKFAQLLGGDMTVTSEVGRGTTFRFDIQARRVTGDDLERLQLPRRPIAIEPGQSAADGGQYRVLIVDDKPDNRSVLVKLLSGLGPPPSVFALREAANGQEAISVWQEWDPHLIWMDVRMPVMGGYEATQRIRAQSGGNAPIIIAVSASSLENERTVALLHGCNDFLRKPFRETGIVELLRKHVGVQFVYAESQENTLIHTAPSGQPDDLVTPKALALLPTEWYLHIKQAVKTLNIHDATYGIEQIRSQHPQLAARLTELVQQYRFDVLQDLFAATMDEIDQQTRE